MGYNTYFRLTTIPELDELSEPAIEFIPKSDFTVNDLINEELDSMKWYNYEEDMKSISKSFPTVVFILDGEGEENGDIWREFFMNGKSYFWALKYELPDFDEKLLI